MHTDPARLPGRAEARRVSAVRPLKEGEWNTLMDVGGPGLIRHIWFTWPPRDLGFGRQNLLRIYWDDEEEPSVEAPIGDFFCMPHGYGGSEYTLDSHYVAVAPNNGFNCYFPMPFARRARLEVFYRQRESGGGFYFQSDYLVYREALPEEWRALRFHAKFRMENPTETYGYNYLTLDAEGYGYLAGTSYGIRRTAPQPDSWYHGGGDSIFIDGETAPHLLHGIGAEDYFGHSWGVREYQGQYVGTPKFHASEAPPEGGPHFETALYRWFVHDPVPFASSIRHVLGAMGDAYSSVAYWYQAEPHREFFALRPEDDLTPEARMKRQTRDVLPDYFDKWSVFGPIADTDQRPFEGTLPIELADNLSYEDGYQAGGQPSTDDPDDGLVRWQVLDAPRGFADLNLKMRPRRRCISLPTGCYGYALGYVRAPANMTVTVRVAFDDRLRLRINDDIVMDHVHGNGFETVMVPVELLRGWNRILVKLSNEDNTTWRAWVFHLAFVDEIRRRIPFLQIELPKGVW